jgi:hypothetical protein
MIGINSQKALFLSVPLIICFGAMAVLQNQISLGLDANSQLTTSSSGAEITGAKSVFETQTLSLSPSVKSTVMTIVDEAHEPPEANHKHISDRNSYLLPANLILPLGADLSFIDADAPWDTPHPHTLIIMDYNSNKIVFTTGKLDYTNSSKPVNLPEGQYIVTDTKYPWIKGNITVSSKQKSADADLVIGAFYTTSNKVLNNQDNNGGVHPGWLGYYRTQFPMNGFQILSEYNFHYAKCKYCPGGFWPDIKSSDHTLLIYSTSNPLSQALPKLSKMIWNNVYI